MKPCIFFFSTFSSSFKQSFLKISIICLWDLYLLFIYSFQFTLQKYLIVKYNVLKVSIFGVFLFVFSRIRTEYKDLQSIFPYLVRMQESSYGPKRLRKRTFSRIDLKKQSIKHAYLRKGAKSLIIIT